MFSQICDAHGAELKLQDCNNIDRRHPWHNFVQPGVQHSESRGEPISVRFGQPGLQLVRGTKWDPPHLKIKIIQFLKKARWITALEKQRLEDWVQCYPQLYRVQGHPGLHKALSPRKRWLSKSSQCHRADGLGLLSGSHMIGENKLLQVVLWSPCGCCGLFKARHVGASL